MACWKIPPGYFDDFPIPATAINIYKPPWLVDFPLPCFMRLEVTSGKGQFRTPTWPKDSWSSRVLTPPERKSLLVLRESIILLVGGIPTPLKNDGVRQLELWNSQFFMESHKNPWFQIPNHQPVSVMPTHGKSMDFFFGPTMSHQSWWVMGERGSHQNGGP